MPRSITILPYGDVRVAALIYKTLKSALPDSSVTLGPRSDADLTIHFPGNSPEVQEKLPELLASGKQHLLLNEYGFGTSALSARERFKETNISWHALGVGEDELGLVFDRETQTHSFPEIGPYHFGDSSSPEMKELFLRTILKKKEGDLAFVFVGAPLDLSKLSLDGVGKIEAFYAEGIPVEIKLGESGRTLRLYNFDELHEEEMRAFLYGSERECLVTGDHALVEALLLGHYPLYELRQEKRGFVYDLAKLIETFPLDEEILGPPTIERALSLFQKIEESDHLWKGFALKLYREFHFAPRLLSLIGK